MGRFISNIRMNKEYYLNLRNTYLPQELKLIFILESPPASGKYFYDETGRTSEPLFNELMKALNYGPIDKKDGLSFFKSGGYFLIDSTYKPVNKLKGKERDNTILEGFNELLSDLEVINPDKSTPIIIVKANVCRLLETKLLSNGFKVLNKGKAIPFPSTGQQKRFQTEISGVLI
jgi:hypothetical protein